MSISHLNPEGVAPPTNGAFTHIVSTGSGTTVYLAGQVGVDVSGKVVGADLASQATQAFENIKTCLASIGATFDNVVKTTIFIVNYTPEDRPVLAAARAPFMPKNPPASTLLGVQALAAPEFLIEVEATAFIP